MCDPRPVDDPVDEQPGRTRLWIDRARRSATARFGALRRRSSIVDALAQTWKHDAEVAGGVMAGALAFRLFLFLVPTVMFFFTAVGTASKIASTSTSDMARVAGISGVLAKGVVNTESLSTGQKWTLLLVSGYAMIVAARSLVSTLAAAVSLAWQMPRVRMRKTIPALAFIVFFVLTSWLTSLLGRLRAASPTPGITLTIAWIAIPLVAIWWLMSKLPHRNAPIWALLPGAVVTAVGLQVMHLVTVIYIATSAESKSETYGVIGISLAALLWCYLTGRLVIGATVLNAALWRRYEANNPGLILSTIEPGARLVRRIRIWLRSALDLFR